jgi:hypothetical protein
MNWNFPVHNTNWWLVPTLNKCTWNRCICAISYHPYEKQIRAKAITILHPATAASEEGLLQPLARRNLQHCISLYADDVVIFLQPSVSDISITLDILQLFGEASGLKTNVQKSTVSPIHCLEEHRALVQAHLPCQITEFPCKYLGVPLSPHKLTKAQVQPIIEKTGCLAGRPTSSQKLVEAF